MKRTYAIIVVFLFLMGCNTNKRNEISFKGIQNFDLDTVLKEAHMNEKSVLLYFSSLACVNCRKIEARILSNSDLTQTIADNYILTTLIADDQTLAEANNWKESQLFKRTLKKIGAINTDWQIELTQTGSQPYFAIISQNKTVSSLLGYTSNDTELFNFLTK